MNKAPRVMKKNNRNARAWKKRKANADLCRHRALQMLDGATINVPKRHHECVTTTLQILTARCNFFAQQLLEGRRVPIAPNLQRCVHFRLEQKKTKRATSAS